MNELRVNFGCGSNQIPGWVNHDIGQDGVDVTKRLPYENNTVDYIHHGHLMEHLSGPDALRFLDECWRILKPGGQMKVCVPVLDRLNTEHGRDIVFNHGHLCAYTTESLAYFIELAGFSTEQTERSEIDGHHRVIGLEKDTLETARILCTKP